jgi:hypothetical protein
MKAFIYGIVWRSNFKLLIFTPFRKTLVVNVNTTCSVNTIYFLTECIKRILSHITLYSPQIHFGFVNTYVTRIICYPIHIFLYSRVSQTSSGHGQLDVWIFIGLPA